jgi:hypothetical protein
MVQHVSIVSLKFIAETQPRPPLIRIAALLQKANNAHRSHLNLIIMQRAGLTVIAN